MAIDENFLLNKIMELSTSIAQISGKIDGFLQHQNGMQSEINDLKQRQAASDAEISALKSRWSTISNRVIGGSAVVSAAIGGFLTMIWPTIKAKMGW